MFQQPGEAAALRNRCPHWSICFQLTGTSSEIRVLLHKQLHDITYRNQKGTSQPHRINKVSGQTVLETTYTNWPNVHMHVILHINHRNESLRNRNATFHFLVIKVVLWEFHTHIACVLSTLISHFLSCPALSFPPSPCKSLPHTNVLLLYPMTH